MGRCRCDPPSGVRSLRRSWCCSRASRSIRVAAAPGQAASGWLPAETLPALGPSLEDARVALDAQGNALAVWTRRSGDSSVLQASWRPAGAGWQPAVDLSARGYVSPYLHVAMTPRGDAVVLWETFVARRYIAMSAARPAGGAWERPVRVSPGSRRPSVPQLALDPRGTAFAVWEQWVRGTTTVRAACGHRRRAGAGPSTSRASRARARRTSPPRSSPPVRAATRS